VTPEQSFAWDEILRWAIQAGASFAGLWLFMVSEGMPLARREELQARWDRLIAQGQRFEAGETRPKDEDH